MILMIYDDWPIQKVVSHGFLYTGGYMTYIISFVLRSIMMDPEAGWILGSSSPCIAIIAGHIPCFVGNISGNVVSQILQ